MIATVQQFIDFKDKEVDEKDFNKELLKHFLNVDFRDKLSLYIAKYKIKDILTLFGKDNHELISRFKYKGIEYGFIPDMTNLSLGEYIDLNTYSNTNADTIKWLSILYRPIKYSQNKLYSIEEYTGKVYPFKDIDVRVLLGAQCFFLSIVKAYQQSLELYLKEVQTAKMN